MGKDRTYPVKVDVIRQLMEDKNISISELAKAIRMDRKSIHNILEKKSQPLERSLALIATGLGVKWRTLVEGFENEPENLEEAGGLAVKTTVTMILDIRRKGITLDMATKLLMSKLEGHLKRADEIRISLLRDEDEN
jgi:transcriptional regulator with XRE-family HTH domain